MQQQMQQDREGLARPQITAELWAPWEPVLVSAQPRGCPMAAPLHSPARQQIVPTGCWVPAPRPDGSSRCALFFAVTFGPATCSRRNFHPSDHLCNK